MEQYNDDTHTPPEIPLGEVNSADKDKERRLKKVIKGTGTLAIAAVVTYGPQALGFIEASHNASGHSVKLTPKGEVAVEYVVDKVASAADAVTGIFRTAPDENGERIEFTIDTMSDPSGTPVQEQDN